MLFARSDDMRYMVHDIVDAVLKDGFQVRLPTKRTAGVVLHATAVCLHDYVMTLSL